MLRTVASSSIAWRLVAIAIVAATLITWRMRVSSKPFMCAMATAEPIVPAVPCGCTETRIFGRHADARADLVSHHGREQEIAPGDAELLRDGERRRDRLASWMRIRDRAAFVEIVPRARDAVEESRHRAPTHDASCR